MRPEFDRSYRELYQRIRYEPYFWPYSPVLHDIVRNAIDEAESKLELKTRLRGDAKWFLLINFEGMILLPIFVAQKAIPSDKEIEMRIRDDVFVIIEAAVEATKETNVEITGHTILDVVSRLWSVLKCMDLEIWG